MTDEKKIEKDGESHDSGKINTGGDFVGGDKNISGGERNINIGGSVTGSGATLFVGDGNIVTNNFTQNVFEPVYQAIEKSTRSDQDKKDLSDDVAEIEAVVGKSQSVDESWLSRRLRNLKKIAPDIAEVALSALAGPGAVAVTVVQKVAARVKEEA